LAPTGVDAEVVPPIPATPIFHQLILDGVFAEAGGLAFALLPAPTGADLLAILDRAIRRVACRLANEAGASNDAGDADPPPDLFAQVGGACWRMACGGG